MPVVGINDVLIRVHRTGICGTDLHIEAWDTWAAATIVPPLVVGHEFVGEIVEVGSNVNDFEPGDLVSGEGHVVCGRCRHCLAGRRNLCASTIGLGVGRDGAFAEYVVLPMTNIWHHWPGVDPEIAAIFDPFGNAVHTALAFPVLGEDVLVSGAGPDRADGDRRGPPCRRPPRRRVRPEPVPPRAGHAHGSHDRGRSTRARSSTPSRRGARDGRGVRCRARDVRLPGAPSGPPIDAMAHGGGIALLGIPTEEITLDLNAIMFKMLTLRGIYGREMYETWYKMTVMLQSGLDISPVITHRFGFRDFEAAFAAARSGESGKVIMDWTT